MIESIEQTTDTEVKITLKNENDFKQYKSTVSPVGELYLSIGVGTNVVPETCMALSRVVPL